MLLVLNLKERVTTTISWLKSYRPTSSNTSSKTYRSILKTFFNGKKITSIPPLNVGKKLVADFEEKARLFNDFFFQNVHQ